MSSNNFPVKQTCNATVKQRHRRRYIVFRNNHTAPFKTQIPPGTQGNPDIGYRMSHKVFIS